MVDWGPLKPVIGIIILIVVIYAIAIIFPSAGDIISSIMQGKIFALSPYGFILVIASGAVAFLGYMLYKLNVKSAAKICLFLSPVCLFFGAFIIELTVFSAFFSKTAGISVTQCTETFKVNRIEDIPVFTTCLFTGYFPAAGISFASLSFATFIIFFWVLPFAFLYYFFYGLFESTMTPMFGGGGTGKTVSIVISFIVAMYGARQMIGTFLIDFLAYGSWGLVGIFIPLLLAVGLKRILDYTIPVRIEEKTVWGAIGVDVWAEVKRLENEVSQLQQAALALSEKGQRLDTLKSVIDEKLRKAEELEKTATPDVRPYVVGAKEILKKLKSAAG